MGNLPWMAETWKDRLKGLVDRLVYEGGNLKSASLEIGLNETGLRDLLRRTSDPGIGTMQKVAQYFGVPFVWLVEGDEQARIRINIVGEVLAGASETWQAIDDYTAGAGEEEFYLGAADPIGLRVRGTSMVPVYRPGDVIIGSRLHGLNIENAYNKDCIIRTQGGDSYIKILRPSQSRRRYVLRSYNNLHEDIEAALEWVAPIQWVRRG